MTLSSKILLRALVNLLLLAVVALVFAAVQLHVRPGNLLFAPAHDRVVQLGRDIALELEQAPRAEWSPMMSRYSANYGVSFSIYSSDAELLAGADTTLPQSVLTEIVRRPRRGPPPESGDREPPPPPPDGPPPPGDGNVFQISAERLFWVGMRIPLPEQSRVRGVLLLSAPSFYGTPLFFNYKPWLIGLAALIAVFVLCWLPFIRNLTRSIAGITHAAGQIAEGHFDHRLPEERKDEIGQLSTAINRMAERLSGFVTGQKRFLGDIAHELCAPIARMQFGLGILDQRTDGPQRQAVADLQDEMRQMSSLIAELLSFSKAGIETERRLLLPVDVAAVARSAVARENAVVEFHLPDHVWALADEGYLHRAISNLTRNATRYAADQGPISVRASITAGEVVVLVQDSGPGLPPTEIERVFAPFHRLDASRARETGGVGLGLAIVKSCVEACGGQVHCRNRVPKGLEVEIRLKPA